MRFTTLGSGSGGNATVVEHAGCALLIDCGLSVRQIERRASSIGFDLSTLAAVLLTHEHDDHLSGARALARRYGTPIFASHGTRVAAGDALAGLARITDLVPEVPLSIGPFGIVPVIVPHDAREPCQFVVEAAGQRLGVLTDLGQSTPHLERHYSGLDGLVLEFNHDPALLAAGPYPRALQARIGGSYGHLSNQQAAEILQRLDLGTLRQLLAAHLSEKTNTPDHVDAELRRCLPGHVARHIATQSEAMPWCDLDTA